MKEEKTVTLQIVEGDLYKHAVVNTTDSHLLHHSEMSEGGVRVTRACEKYIEDQGPLDVGKVVSLSPGMLCCYFLFHVVLLRVGEDSPSNNAITSVLRTVLSEANDNNCRSLSLQALDFTNKVILKIISTICDVVSSNDVQHVQVIRIVGRKKTVLRRYLTALSRQNVK